jgi:hypothetical protein
MKALLIILALTTTSYAGYNDNPQPPTDTSLPPGQQSHCNTTCDPWGQNCHTDCSSANY